MTGVKYRASGITGPAMVDGEAAAIVTYLGNRYWSVRAPGEGPRTLLIMTFGTGNQLRRRAYWRCLRASEGATPRR